MPSDQGKRGDQTAARGGEAGRRHRLDLERYVPALLNLVANKMSHSAGVTYRRRFGVSATEWRIMSLLAIEPAITATRIRHVIGLDKGPVSRALAALERRDLVASAADASDARKQRVNLTKKGDALHDEIYVVAMEREELLLSGLTTGERESLIRSLNHLHVNLPALLKLAVPPRNTAGRQEGARDRPPGVTPQRSAGEGSAGRTSGRRSPRA